MALSSTICFLDKTTHEPIETNILKSDSAALALIRLLNKENDWFCMILLIDFRRQGSNKKQKQETKQVIHRNHFILKETWLGG